ncbi:glycosyltransferase [Gordonia sp. NPDC003424]
MRAGDVWDAVVVAGTTTALASVALAAHNACTIRRPDPVATPEPEPLTVLLPVRDEAHNVIDCLTGILAALDRWPGPGRVVVLDDESTDGTSGLLAEFIRRHGRVEVVRGSPTPPGWLGKPWACEQLSRSVIHDDGVLIFIDADVRVAPRAFVSSVALLRAAGLDLVSPYPQQRAVTMAERLVQPLLQWSWMSTLPLGVAERSARESLSAANGQLMVLDTAAYRRAGGHAAVCGEVLEDIALLRAIKRCGGRGVVTEGSSVADCRMYMSLRDLRAGYRKSLWSAFGSLPGTIAVVVWLNATYVVPAIALLGGSRIGLVGYLAGVGSRAIAARTTRGRLWPDVVAHPVSILAFTGLTVDSVVAHRRDSLAWKGRPVVVR